MAQWVCYKTFIRHCYCNGTMTSSSSSSSLSSSSSCHRWHRQLCWLANTESTQNGRQWRKEKEEEEARKKHNYFISKTTMLQFKFIIMHLLTVSRHGWYVRPASTEEVSNLKFGTIHHLRDVLLGENSWQSTFNCCLGAAMPLQHNERLNAFCFSCLRVFVCLDRISCRLNWWIGLMVNCFARLTDWLTD